MSFSFNQKTFIILFLPAITFGFLFSVYIPSALANHYAVYPYGVLTPEGGEYCNSKSECDTLCESRSIAPLGCFYFYGDSGLAPQKAGYFKKIAVKARRALEVFKANGGPDGSRTEEEYRKYDLKYSIVDGLNRSFSEKSIRDSLIGNGWATEDIDQAFNTVRQMSKDEFRKYSLLFTIEGIYINNVGPEEEVMLKTIIQMAEALEKAAREKIKPPSICGYGLMCFGECSDSGIYDSDSDTYGEPTPECKKYFEETGYDTNKDTALKDIVLDQLIQTSDNSPGDCTDLFTCKVYCDAEEHWTECTEFADKNDLKVKVSNERKDVLTAIEKGDAPGECKDEVSCRKYCGNADNVGECADFAEKFDLVTPDELGEMRKLSAAREAGVSFPGNCKDKESCLSYCDNSVRAVECIEFAQKAGLLNEEENKEISKILPYLKQGGKLPGGCGTKESCDAYCESDTHTNECVDFAVGAGFMNKEEAEIVKKVGGKGPGNCKSREACDSYCKDATHSDECIDFAVKAGFVSKEDAEMAKKFGVSSGPGDCKSKAECETFCVISENQETCSNWAKEHGMDISNRQAGPGGCKSKEECTAYCKDHQEECQKFAPPGGEGMQDRGAEECVKQGGTQDGKTCKFPKGQSQFNGPGGCKTPDECRVYCESNPQACQGSMPPGEDHGAEECLKQGGNLKDGQCYFHDPTEQNIGVDRGGEECAKQGGSWTGTQCNFSKKGAGIPGDQSQIPQGYSSWEAFCRANSGDSRCAAYAPQIQQQYPLLLRYSPLAAILNFLLGARK